MIRVALIEDQDDLRRSAARTLEEVFGFSVVTFAEVPLRARRVDVVVLDLHLRETDGEKSVTRCREAFGATPIIAWTGTTDRGRRRRAIAAGAEAVVTKGDSLAGLADIIDQVYARDTRPFDLRGLAADRDRLDVLLHELVAMGT